MSPHALSDATAAVKALFASGAPAAQDVTDGLSDLLAAVQAADGPALKAGQRDAEDAALLVVLQPPGGGPPQRALAASVLCSLFTRGNSIAMFARVSELTALLTAKGVTKAQPAAVRLGALYTLTALTRAVGPQLAGSYGRLITDVCPIHLAGEATVRCAALDLLAAAVEHMPSLTLAAQETALKCARTGAGDKMPAVRSFAMTVLRSLAVGADGAGLYLGDRGAKGEVLLECVALSQAGIKGMDKGERDAAAAALGALAAAAQLPPAAAALGAAVKPEARKALAKALSDPVGEWVGASFVLAKSRPVRQAAADAWVAMLAATARRVEDSTVVTSGATAVLALKALAVNTQRVNAGDEDFHAAACALYILRAGAARFLPEAGQRALLAALTAHLAGADGGAEAAPPPLMVATALRGITDTLARLGEVPAEVASATEASLRRCLVGGATADVRVEAALALRALALAYPPCASALLRAGLAGVRGVDPGLVDGPLAVALHGHTCLTVAVLACAPSLPLGVPAELPRATAEAAMQLLDARSPLVKSCGWTLLAAALAGPGGPADAEAHGSTLLLMWNIAFAREGVLAPPKRAGQPSELRTKGLAGATELLWRVAAAEALDAFLRTAVCMGDRAAAGAVASLVPTLKAALTLAADPALGDAAGAHGTYERTACSLFKLRVLEALQSLPDAGVYAAVHPEAVALARGCLDSGALPARQLLLLLLHPGDAALGPVPPGADALQDALRVFEGAYDAAPPKLWVPVTLSERASETGGQLLPQVQQAHGSGGVGPFPSPMPVAMALAEVQVIECGRLIAATTAAGTPLGLLPQLSAAAKAGYPVSRDLAAKAPAVSVLGTRAPSSSLRSEAAAGGSPQLTNAAAAGLAAVAALGARQCTPEDAYELDVLACTLLGDPAPGAAHMRAAAELRGGAVRLTRAPEAAANTVNDVIRQLRESHSSATARAALALCVGALFRAVGGMAMTTSVAQAHEALAQVSAQPDSSAGSGGGGAEAPRTHVWAAHALYLVAAAAGAGYLRHAPATLGLAHELLSNDAAVQAPQLVASAGRLVNAAVSALGPELQPGGRTLTRCVTLIDHVRASSGDDPGAQLQQLLFLQACALFAPRALPPAVVAPQLRDALQSRQPPVRAAAAAVAHNLSETNAAGMLPEAMEGPLFGLLDYEWDAPAVADARGALEALLRADAPEQPVRWLQLTGAITCADFAARAAQAAKAGSGRGAGGDDNEEDADAAVASATAATATMSVAGASLSASAPLPSWRTRTLAAEFMCRLPDSVGPAREHTDLVAARAAGQGQWLVQHQTQAVDLGYRVATGPATSLRPWGLVLLRRLLAKCGGAVDPDVPGGGALLMEQDTAQLLSSLRAALAPTALPPAWAQGAALAAELLASGLVARDGAVQQRLVALLTSTTSAVGLQPSVSGDAGALRPAPAAGGEALAFGEWAVGCAKAALLAAHSRLVLAVPTLAPLRAAHTKAAPQLNAGWLALLHDTAHAVGLAPGGGDAAGGVLPLRQVPIAQHVVARAHLADAWRPVLAAVVAGAYPVGGSPPSQGGGLPGGLALSSEQHTLLLSLSCWALTRPAAIFMRDASRPDGNGPCGVWGLCAGFLPGEPHPAACGAAALVQLLAPHFLVAPGSQDGPAAGATLATVADVVAAVSEAACSRGAHPALEAAAPGLLAAILEALPPGFLAFALNEDAGEEELEEAYGAHCEVLEALGSSCLALAGQALQRALTSAQPETQGSAVNALGAVATLLAALAADEQAEASDAVAALPGAALDLAVQAFQVPGQASAPVAAAAVALVTAAAAAGVAPAQLDGAAEALASSCLDCADSEEAASGLGPLLDAMSALSVAPGAKSGTRKRCRETIVILLDEEASCPFAVQREALAALFRAFSAASSSPAGSRVRKNAASMLSSMGPTLSAAVGAAIAASGDDEDASAAASDGIKALAAALALADSDGDKVGVLTLLVPLLISAAAPGDGEAHSPGLQSMAVTLITRTAAAMAAPFKDVLAEQPADSRERLQAALKHTNGHTPDAPVRGPVPAAPVVAAKAALPPPALDVEAFKKAAAKAPPASFDDFDAFEAGDQEKEEEEEPEADDSEEEGF